MHVRRVEALGRRRPVADQERSVQRVERGEAMTAAHEAGVERHHVEERAEAELLLDQTTQAAASRPEAHRIKK